MKYPEKGKYKIMKSKLDGWYIQYNTDILWLNLWLNVKETYYDHEGDSYREIMYFTSLKLAREYIDNSIKCDIDNNTPDEFIEFYPPN